MDNALVKKGDAVELSKLFERRIMGAKIALEQAKRDEEKLMDELKAEMEKYGVVKIETDALSISYIQPTNREVFDSKALREASPELYDAFVKVSPVGASVRVRLKT